MKKRCLQFVVDEVALDRRQCTRNPIKGDLYCKRHLTKMKRLIPEEELARRLHKYKGKKSS